MMREHKPIHTAMPRLALRGRVLLCCAGLLLGLATLAAAQGETVYAKVDDAKVRSGTEVSAPIVASLKKGTAMTVVEKAGTRLKVTVPGGQQGYISRLHVSDTKPDTGGGMLSGIARSEVQANEAQMVASIRGLSPAAKDLAQNQGLREDCIRWADVMENRSAQITKSQVEQFLQVEGIGF
jgi:uncharacterized protein YgiM (DUF1202 family)